MLNSNSMSLLRQGGEQATEGSLARNMYVILMMDRHERKEAE